MSPLLLTLSSMQGGKHVPLITDTLLHAGGKHASLLLTLSSMQGGKHVPLITATPPLLQEGKDVPLITDTLLHAVRRQTCPPYY